MSTPKKPGKRRVVSSTKRQENAARDASVPDPVRRAAQDQVTLPDIDDDDDDDLAGVEIHVNGSTQLTWPMQFDLVRTATQFALQQCNEKEIAAVGEFMLQVAIRVLDIVDGHPTALVKKGSPIDQLMDRLHRHADEKDMDVFDLVEDLLRTLEPSTSPSAPKTFN